MFANHPVATAAPSTTALAPTEQHSYVRCAVVEIRRQGCQATGTAPVRLRG
jgi:hypothetical protein